MKNSKFALVNICLMAGVFMFLFQGCGGTTNNNQTLKSATGTTVNPNDNSSSCDCSSEQPSNNEQGGMVMSTDDANNYSINYLSYQNLLRGRTELDVANDYVKGGVIRKADLIAIINSLPAGEEYVHFDFGMADPTLEADASPRPYARTCVIFHGGPDNPCNYTSIPSYGSSQPLIYRNGMDGFCPPRCDTGVYASFYEYYKKNQVMFTSRNQKLYDALKKIEENSRKVPKRRLPK